MIQIYVGYAYEFNKRTQEFSGKTVLSVHKTLEGAEAVLDKQEKFAENQSDFDSSKREMSRVSEEGYFKGGTYVYQKRNRRIQHWFRIEQQPLRI